MKDGDQAEKGENNLLTLIGVTAGYQDKVVLKNIYLDIPNNSVTVIMGRNGAGKTTLLKTIAGFTRLHNGRIVLDGKDITRMPTWKREIGLLLNPHPLIEFKTVLENLETVANLAKKSGRQPQNPYHVARRIGIENLLEEKVSDLSRGQKQLVGLAQIFVSQPKIILMDEPFSNLDYFYRERITNIILEELFKNNITVIMTTHELADIVLTGSTRIIILENGSIAGILTENDLIYGKIRKLNSPLPNLFLSFIKAHSPIASIIYEKCNKAHYIEKNGNFVAIPPVFVKIYPIADGFNSFRECDLVGFLAGRRLIAPGVIFAFVKVGEELLITHYDFRYSELSSKKGNVCIKFKCY